MKKKIFALMLCVVMMAIAIVGGTMAYFTDTDAQTNTFTAGKVDIFMDEAVVALDETTGNLIADGDKRTSDDQDYHLYPAMTVIKDPTITVEDDSENAYIAAIITVNSETLDGKNLYDLIGLEGTDLIDLNGIVSGGLMDEESASATWNGLTPVFDAETCHIYQAANKAEGTWTIYIFLDEAMSAGENVTLFDTISIPAEWDNAEMALVNEMTIGVVAYATQTNGFADCFTAITTAFGEAFAAVKPATP